MKIQIVIIIILVLLVFITGIFAAKMLISEYNFKDIKIIEESSEGPNPTIQSGIIPTSGPEGCGCG